MRRTQAGSVTSNLGGYRPLRVAVAELRRLTWLAGLGVGVAPSAACGTSGRRGQQEKGEGPQERGGRVEPTSSLMQPQIRPPKGRMSELGVLSPHRPSCTPKCVRPRGARPRLSPPPHPPSPPIDHVRSLSPGWETGTAGRTLMETRSELATSRNRLRP